ncbi:MAG: leucine-rich repeat domain-containing protein [Paludibacteraceae bacterium]|nr:leucine-rich repeat domain-containing protein [Paludibacteraceae bacterium]
MKKRIYYILTIILCLTWGAGTTYTHAQTTDGSIFVVYVSPAGKFDNTGNSWGEAKNNLQSAIDVLYDIPEVRQGVKRGYVFVAGTEDNGAGEKDDDDETPISLSATYVPNRSTDDAERSTVNTSFRIYPNIYVIGGFRGDETVPSSTAPEYAYCKTLKELTNMRWLSSGKRYGEMIALHSEGEQGTLDESRSWDFKYKSILSGNHHTTNYTFTFDPKRGVYNTTFPLSSYHVVWFGTNGVIDPSEMTLYEPNINTTVESSEDRYQMGNIYYTLDTKAGTATVTRSPLPTGYTGDITIPAAIKIGTTTYKVTEIRNGAFAECTGLTAVTIGNNVTTIGQAAFDSCINLTSVTFGKNVTNIMRFAFFQCGKLATINHPGEKDSDPLVEGFPSSIKLIDRWAFGDCENLATATVPATINYIGRYAFRGTSIDTNTLPVYEKEETEMTGRYKGLPYKSKVAGFTIEGGNASSTNLIGHDHTGFGGGVYMVRNTEIEDCIIHHCSATQRGGAVYLDGGGDVNYCYIHTCQATGFGMQQGYGGGVCIDYDGQVEHCYITQCAARAGAGLAICHDPDEYPEETAPMADPTFYEAYKDNEDLEASVYSPFAKASLITNCTSNAEGAGVYLNYGGSLDHLTVVNNECIGPDVIYYGMRHGRTGGIYVREAAAISNTVVWGNKCHVNSDIQFAAFKKEDYFNISVDHSAFSKGDISDWSAVVRKAVINLNDVNYPTASFNTGNFAMFQNPSRKAGIMHDGGVVNPADTAAGSAYQDAYYWHPLGMSSMRGKGKQIVDVTVASRVELMHANATQDLLGIKFESVSVCGAITNSYHDVRYAMMPSLEHLEGRISYEGDVPTIPTIFVDPNMVATDTLNREGKVGFRENQAIGYSWTYPIDKLQDAVFFFSQYLVDPVDETNCTSTDYSNPAKSYYRLPLLDPEGHIQRDGAGNIIYDETHYPNVQILMKEGSTNVAGRGAYLTGHIRTAAVRPVSKMRLYGGFPKASTETDMTGRQPYKYKSEVRADVTGGDFNDHSVHVFSIANMHDIIIDGFRLIGGNGNIAKPDPAQMSDKDYAEEMALYNSVANGGGVAMNNSRETFPRDMTGNILRNCVIANCAATEGAAIFVNGDAEHGSEDRKCIAELTVVNTVIRNCTAGDTWDNPDRYVANDVTPMLDQITYQGICSSNGENAKIVFRNCDLVNNCGFPFRCTPIENIPAKQTPPYDPTYGGRLTDRATALADPEISKIGSIEVYNTVVFSNGLRVHADRSGISSTVFCPKESWYKVTGEYIYMGYDVMLPKDFVDECGEGSITEENLEKRLNSKHIYRILTHNKSEDRADTLYYRYNDGSQQGFDVKTKGTPEQKNAFRVKNPRHPDFVNPSRNVGHSITDDKSFYGGAVNYEPLPTNPIVNAANAATEDTGTGAGSGSSQWVKVMGYDISLGERNYGGDPDIGAIETQRLPKGGTVLYVTPDGAGRRDGSSWANAIAGNTIYALNETVPAAGTDGFELDANFKRVSDRIINTTGDGSAIVGSLNNNGVLTTDPRYCGGFAQSWFTEKRTGVVSTTTITDTWNIEKNVYDDGGKEDEIIHEDTEPTRTTNTEITDKGEIDGGFTPGLKADTRFPYGELSGASRTFWRANPYSGAASDYTKSSFISGVKTNGWINNTRSENYVGGLQYAVETAAAYNADGSSVPRISGVDSIQVWVSNGIYTDYKGFVMRDNTTVMGGFPAKDGGTPGLAERQALMSAVIDIPKSLPTTDLNPLDYETVLQISNVNLIIESNRDIDTSAIMFWDDDLTLSSSTDTRIHEYKTHFTINHYGKEVIDKHDVTDKIYEPSFATIKTYSTVTPTTITDQGVTYKYYTLGNTAAGDKDKWHMKHPDKTNYVADRVTDANAANKSRGIYDPITNERLKEGGNNVSYSGNWIFIGNGSLTGLEFWQTIPSLPAGSYELSVDMAGGYRNKFSSTDPTNIYFKILGSDGTTELITPIMLKTIGSTTNDDNSGNNRNMAYRYVVRFNQTAEGSVSIKIEVEDGVRNTKSANPSYGTDDGGDPETIPAYYVSNYGVNNPNRREFWMSDLLLYNVDTGDEYVLVSTDYSTEDRSPSESQTTAADVYSVSTHRTTIRKRVLTMPDVCVPTYGGGGIGNPVNHDVSFNDELPHTDRVTGEVGDLRTASTYTHEPDDHYVGYSDVNWDGFTIRHGFIYDEAMCHGGGSGVNMYEGAHLRNCIVINNYSAARRVKGGGIFCDGATSTIEGCFVLNNTSMHGSTNVSGEQKQVFAGGLFMYEGTCFNSLFANNYSYGSAGGVGFCVGRFFNNTIAYNTCSLVEDGGICGGAVSLATTSNPNLFVANTIIYGNSGIAIRDRNTGVDKVNPFLHCYIQSEIAQPNNATIKNVTNHSEDGNCHGIGNVFLNGPSDDPTKDGRLSADNTPFSADLSYDGSGWTGEASSKNDFRLTPLNGRCINKGTEDFAGTLLQALLYKKGAGKESEIKNSFIYKSVEAASLPEKDVAYAARVQDCRIDMGAYEYDGTRAIEPTLYPESKKAIFYVTEEGYGTASASSADDAACAVKFQKVLDAAGRWRYASYKWNDNEDKTQKGNNFGEAVFREELVRAGLGEGEITAELSKLKDYEVIVRLEGNALDDSSPFSYVPTRSVNPNSGSENVLMYSLIVPHGIRVEGGYEDSFENPRDVLGRPTYLDGTVNESGGRVFHVVTFTNDLFTVDEQLFSDGNETLHDQLAFLSDTAKYCPEGTDFNTLTNEQKAPFKAKTENSRVVLDGVFLQNGNAAGSEEYYQNGGAAIVTDYAHIRNCVVQNNYASGCGGGLYLNSRALVSGCVIKENSANYGAGIYVYEPDADAGTTSSPETFAHILSSTIANNTATVSAGGLFFATNVRANSLAIWHNTANANPNVAGTDATGMTQLVENYPMNYCGVESRRMAGVNNIELPAAANQGVRWDNNMIYDRGGDGQKYFPITRASVLTRAGMPYASYLEMRAKYPTLELTDIFGLNRLAQTAEDEYLTLVAIVEGDSHDYLKEIKDNAFIEIGARVLNADFQVKLEFTHVMKRLFVTTTERLPTTKAVALQENTEEKEFKTRFTDKSITTPTTEQAQRMKDDVAMYKQMGSCFLNPMLRVGDALDYIIRVRKTTDQPYVVNGKAIKTDGTVVDYVDDGTEYKSVADVYKDVRFEIFICGGTFYPYKDAYGNQGESRANTFVVPEKVTIVGGVNHDGGIPDGDLIHPYCQEGYEEDVVRTEEMEIAGFPLERATTLEIRTERAHQDRNGNNVDEPWEMKEQTILSGAAVQNDAKANIYHVITCLVNTERVGQLPTRKDAKDNVLDPLYNGGLTPTRGELLANLEAETQKSRDARIIIIDGVTITGGYANKIDVNDESANAQTLTYFRGGGILVEGNWDATFDTKGDLPEVLGVAKRDIPLILTACLIKDNVAGNGGGLYSNGTIYNFGCHYTQNLAIGPITAKDQDYIPWTAGGAIATNYQCHLWNSLFDNNEARRAPYHITHDAVHNADARQGYAGVISSSETSLVRACNCDFVRNKAVAFPAIYNFFDNNLRAATSALTPSDENYYGRGWHFAVNSIFWGNQATMPENEHVAEAQGWEKTFYDNLYGSEWTDERKPYHVANFAPKLDVATLTFCSYQEETGRDGTVWWSNQDNAKSAPLKPKTYPAPIGTLDGLTRLYAGLFTDVLDEYFGYYKNGDPEHPYYVNENLDDPASKYIPSKLDSVDLKYNGYPSGDEVKYVYTTTGEGARTGHINHSIYDECEDENAVYALAMDTLKAVAYNYNLVLSKENNETGGPFFVLPSLTAGVDGYMETANWLVSRLNNTIDTGWGFLKQNVKQPNESNGLYETSLLKIAENEAGDTIKDESDHEILVPVGYYLYTIEQDLGGGKTKTVPVKADHRFKRVERKLADGTFVKDSIYGEADTILVPLDREIVLAEGTEINDPLNYTWVYVSNYKRKDKSTGIEYTDTIFRKSWNTVPKTIASDTRLEEQYHDLFGDGFYNIHSKNIHLRFHDIGYPNLLPIGDDTYMTYVHEGETESLNMRRISTHPKMGVQDVFIDMGIYEYQYVQLITSGDEVDVLWVGPEDGKYGNDGSSCQKATSNLQEAIETLLRSRNDHDKMIKLIGSTKKSYTPQTTVNSKNKAFFIEVPSRTDGVTLPKTLTADDTHSVKSFTLRGGYPADITDLDDGEDRRDIEAYPVVFEMQKETGNSEQSLAHLFIIEDAGEKGCYMNYLTNTNKDFKDNVMPIVLDGITFMNPYGENETEGGAAIYYKPQYRLKESGGSFMPESPAQLLKPATYKIGEDTFSIPKLIVKNCIVKASGANKAVSAVKIEKGGGQTLIVNSLFHSNSGNPLEAVNTKIVNSTFALNGGHIKLVDETEQYLSTTDNPVKPKDYPSGLYNSIIWRDDQANGETTQIERLEDTDLTASETLVEKPTMPMKYNAITKKDADPEGKDERYKADSVDIIIANAWLHRTNKNVFLGPNFVDPKETFADGMSDADKLEQKKSRNFHINPSARFINNADTTTYLSIVPFYAEQSLLKQITVIVDDEPREPYIFHSVQRLDRPKYVIDADKNAHWYNPEPLTEKNLKGIETAESFPAKAKEEWYPFRRTTATIEEWEGDNVDIKSTLTNMRVPYTEHELAFKNRYDGAGMELGAYECSAALQRVLYVWEGSTETPDGSSWEKAFKRDELQNAIDVASIYSTIKSPRERAYVFVASDEDKYNQVVKVRDGVSVFGGVPTTFYDTAKHTAGIYNDNQINEYINKVVDARSMTGVSVSTIVGLESDENATTPELGFVLDGFVLSAGAKEGTPFHLDKHLTVLKNCVVTGNKVNSGPVIQMDKGLLYNSLVFGNTVSGAPVVQVATATDANQAGVLNCTVVADHSGEVALSATAKGSVVNTITYNEEAKNLSRGESSADAFVLCNTGVDNMFAPYFRPSANSYDLPEAFTNMRPLWYQLVETSTYINGGQDTTTTMESSIFSPYAEFINYADIATEEGGGSVKVGLAGDRDPLGNPRLIGTLPDVGCFETWYVNGNYKATNQTDVYLVNNYGGHKYPHTGSVLYVMEDANLVVETNEGTATFFDKKALRPGYVLVKNGGSIYGQGNTLEFSYVAAERDFLSQQYALLGMPFKISHKDASIKAYAYNGETRSSYNYQFLNENSTAWEEITGDIEANEGWLADMGSSFTGTKRFTGWGDDFSTYVYSESGDSKTVLLIQYDKRTSGTGSGLSFTREEDMGWNLKGLPYLVANYHTYDPASGDDYHMNIPHIFYKDNTTDYLDNTTVETVQSWESTATLSPGYGFFTQTAVIDVKSGENLVFKVPTYSGDAPAYAPARPIVLMRDMDKEGDLLTVNPDEGAPKTINYSLGRDGVKWMMTDAPQLYLLSAAKSRLSLLGAAPTEVDIPLGVSVPEDSRYQDMPRYFTFSLPEPEAFENYQRVWLIDKALNRVTNLVDQTYAAALSPGTDNSRFYLRIGGFPFGNDQRREYIVYAWKRQLHIRGLVEGDQIRVYSLTGQLILSTTARDPEFTAELPQAGGVYAVRVNDFSTKVRNL